MKRHFLFLLVCLLAIIAEAKVQLPQLFQSGMVSETSAAAGADFEE